MDLARIIASLPPGTVFIIGLTPAGDIVAQPAALEKFAAQAPSVVPDPTCAMGATPLEVARAQEAKHGLDEALKVSEWKKWLAPKVSGRQVEDAIKEELLMPANEKVKGRGNRARLVTVRVMLQFLEAREQARRGTSVPVSEDRTERKAA
jgi:hypothetical protein